MLTWLWHYIRPYRLRLLAALVALVFTAGMTLSLGQGLKLMIDQGFVEGSVDGLWQSLQIFLVLVVAMSLGAYCRFYLVSWLGERVVADIRKDLYLNLVKLHPGFFDDNHSGEIQSRVTTDTTLLQSVIGSEISFALRNSLIFLGGLVLMLLSNLKLSLMVLVAVPLIIFPLIHIGRRIRKLSSESQEKVADAGAWVGESLQNLKVVQAFNREDVVVRRFNGAAETAFDVAIQRIKKRALLICLVMLLVLSAVGGMLYVGGSDVVEGHLSGGDLAAFVFYAIMVAGSLAAVTEVYGELQRAAGAVDRIRELMAWKSDITEPEAPSAPEKVGGSLEFNQVTYAYPSRLNEPAIEALSLNIKPGERVALVGPSGAGKSTIFELLLRFRDPLSGQIMLDGVPIHQMKPSRLRSYYALVPQHPVLFSANVWENLRYGDPDATDEAVIAAAKAAHADEFIQQLPQGYSSYLGERGVKLSGGQQQRLAIARAILRDPEILLLDEATSALDAQSEFLVQQALDRLMKDRTTLIIAHRLATITHVDRIAVMDKGKLVATGTHEELLETSVLYSRLAELQFNAA
ncbi:ABC transporter transmembrane domain-containing protein [Endozoicomonas numazuensis]|uniref:ABC transporter ATP-binding protein n=1 Tax=Endozoicomonas numazuensis TaxID=1137799 RepID=A0A081N002_9GAMM|nr:ABC transporter transmembrane domain-containing protein [Endozoicomonas numazuensis]KEQ11775.1 ABC transporter ATP-binding protein [Endozoicomonas numazuensis]